jgi:hypothetical protein
VLERLDILDTAKFRNCWFFDLLQHASLPFRIMADGKDIGPAIKLTKSISYESWLKRLKIRLDALSTPGFALVNALQEVNDLTATLEAKAMRIVLMCITDDDMNTVFDMDSTFLVMEWLKKKYLGDTTAKCATLWKQLSQLKLQPGESITVMVDRALEFQRQLAIIGQPQTDNTIIMMIMNALPASYKMCIEIFRQTKGNTPEFTVDQLRQSLMMSENDQAEGNAPKAETKALMARQYAGTKRLREDGDVNCFRCGEKGHTFRECSSNTPKPGWVDREVAALPKGPGTRGRGFRGRGFRGKGFRGGRFGRGGRGGRFNNHPPAINAVAPVPEAALVALQAGPAAAPVGQQLITLSIDQLRTLAYRGDGAGPNRAYIARPDHTGETDQSVLQGSRSVLDSGAGVNCSPIGTALTEFTSFDRKVTCANDTYMLALGSGTLHATSRAEMGDKHIVIDNVWYVPGCMHTLISVKALQAKGWWGVICGDTIHYYNQSDELMFVAFETELGYEIDWSIHNPVKPATYVINSHSIPPCTCPLCEQQR